MKKTIIKIICFALVFVLLWKGADYVLGYDWKLNGNLPERYLDFEDDRDTDVLFLGASNTYRGIVPAEIWGSSGITSFNLGVNAICPMQCYYQLKYALEYQTPSLVVMDVSSISTPVDANGAHELPFRMLYMTLPDRELKAELMNDMCTHLDDVDPLMYYFPLLRFHERWDELQQEDFDAGLREEMIPKYKSYLKGCAVTTTIKQFSLPDDLFDYSRTTALDLHMEYLEKIYDLCEENGIEMMLLYCPRLHLYYAVHEGAEEFAAEHGINYLSFTTAEELEAVGIDPAEDYYDKHHLNMRGQKKFSDYLAGYLTDQYSLGMHEDDPELCAEWDGYSARYTEYYEKNHDSMRIKK